MRFKLLITNSEHRASSKYMATGRSKLIDTDSVIPSDVRSFLRRYPASRPSPSNVANLEFYRGQGPARPSTSTIAQLHKELEGNYRALEHRHDFIQWIFPIREAGMNWASQPLELHEAEMMMLSPVIMERVLVSYNMMLDFFGFRLVDSATGQLSRSATLAPDVGSWRQRYANLSSSSHNYLRISRILKSLSELGLEHLNKVTFHSFHKDPSDRAR